MAEGNNHNASGMYAFLFSMVFVFVFFVVIISMKGIDLGENIQDPKKEEVSTFDIASVKEPWAPTEAQLKDFLAYGQKMYVRNCAICHGQEGKGDGPSGKAVNARNLVTGPWKQGGGLINHFKTLQNGIPGTGMAAWKHVPKADRWAIVHYIENITEAKEHTDPAAVAEFAKTAD